ncbi:MAG: thioredoxin family protein [Verrucomicrobiota bacterium]
MTRLKRRLTTPVAALAALLLAAGSLQAAGESWMDNFKEAQELAKKHNQLILADFTGSDWCGWCIRLDKEVFSKPEFQEYVKDKFVLVELDFPRQKKQEPAIEKQNKELAEKYGVRGFPTVLVLKPDGEVVEQLGYMEGGPKAFIKALEKAKDKA